MNKDMSAIRDSISKLKNTLEKGSLGQLRRWVRSGAQEFSDPDRPRVKLMKIATGIAEAVRTAQKEAIHWRDRSSRTAAAPIALDRHERIEEFLMQIDAAVEWAEKTCSMAESGAIETRIWIPRLIEMYDTVLFICRSMRRVALGDDPSSMVVRHMTRGGV